MPDKSSFKDLKQTERETRKGIILEAAIKLFNEKVLHRVGMRDIAAETGISAATIYRYFDSRDDIIVEALVQDINAIEKRLEVLLKNEEITIKELAVAVVDYLLDNEPTFQMMCYFLTSSSVDPEARKKFDLVQEYFINMFNMKLNKKGFSSHALFTNAFFASICGVVLTFRNYPGLNPEEKREYMHQMAMTIITEGGALSMLKGNNGH
ncbi:MAG: TetR/AcrR family transcriptional regulator [Desulfosudaceae bacterium]